MLNIKEIKTVDPDYENRVIWATLKSGEVAKIKIPNRSDYWEKYAIIKNKVHKTHEIVGTVNRKLKSLYVKEDEKGYIFIRDYDLKRFTKDELIEELECNGLVGFMSVYRNTGSYYGDTFRAFKNGEEIELYQKENTIEVVVYRCLETGEVLTVNEWVNLLNVTKNYFYTHMRTDKKIKNFNFEKAGTKKVGRAKNDKYDK